MPERNGGSAGDELVFKAKVSEIFEAELQRRLKGMKLLLGAFIGGFALFIAAGLTWKDNLLRPLVGYQPSRLLPVSALGGAALLLAADIAVRLLARGPELKLGVLTALIGAPVFLYLILKTRRTMR